MKRISLSIAAATAAVIGTTALFAGVASAHHPVAVGQTSCMTDGGWTVTWTVGNSESAAGRVMTFDSSTVNGVPISLSPGSVAPSGSATATSTHDAVTNSATLNVTGRWAYITPNPTASATATVAKPTNCVAPTTTTTTTTTVAPTTTTVVEVTTTAPQVDDTTVTSGATGDDAATRIDAPQVDAEQVVQESIGAELPATGAVSVPILLGGAGLVLVGMALVVAARRNGASA